MPKRESKVGEPGYRHPYVEYESGSLWPLVDKGISDLVENLDLVEKENREYIVGYLCKVITKGLSRGGVTTASAPRIARSPRRK